jgi:hypothetical protein
MNWPDPFADEVEDSIWPSSTLRGEYDSDHDRIVCALCDWYDTGGPTGCRWRYHDHLTNDHH